MCCLNLALMRDWHRFMQFSISEVIDFSTSLLALPVLEMSDAKQCFRWITQKKTHLCLYDLLRIS